ncbi:MAG TPA: Uma2 family endonuclease [Planctomycetota bacterium]|nr:Uma2 family endonuclease [Planctomycetota bacterium]
MSSSATKNRLEPAIPSEPIWRLTVEEYHEMVRTGIIGEDDNVELLEGFLVQKMTKYPAHSFSSGALQDAIGALNLPGYFLRMQDPITFKDSEPEPDLALVRGQRRDFTTRHPHPSEVAFIAEVADASLYRDKGLKKRIYAMGGIPVYGIVNVSSKRIEVFTDPDTNGNYQKSQQFGTDQHVPVIVDGREVSTIPAKDLFQ